MTIRYTSMTCRSCGSAIEPTVAEVDKPKQTGKYEDCNFVCPNADCRIGYSNATNEADRTAIAADYLLNIPVNPPGLRVDLPPVIDRAINIRNRASKKLKFAFSTSEDAVTWVTFWYLNQRKEVAKAFGDGDSETKALLLWGSSLKGYDDSVPDSLLQLLRDRLHENPSSFSEPDVIAIVGNRLIFAEVKYTSPNESKDASYSHWDKYLGAPSGFFATASERVREAGYYELTRNWVIGKLLAAELGLDFTLINLGPDSCRVSSGSFHKIIADEPGEYRFVTWPEFVDGFRQPLADWFELYITEKLTSAGIERN